MVQPCNLKACGINFSDRKCKCYAEPAKEGIESTRDQFCGFKAEDGIVYGCDPGCCGDGCPGQCPDVAPRPPERFITNDAKVTKGTKGTKLEVLMIILIMLSTLVLTGQFIYSITKGT